MARPVLIAASALLAAALLASRAPALEPVGESTAAESHADPWLAGPASATDPVLRGLVARAIDSSPLLAQARFAAEAGEARVSAAGSAFLPTVGAAERFTSTDNPPLAFFSILNQGRFSPASNVNDPGTVNDWATQLYARYLLFDFGRRWAGLEAARADADRLRLLVAAARRDVRFAVSAAYHDLLRAHAAVALWEETVRLFEARERLAQTRFDAGEVLRSDVLSVQVRLADARQSLVTAEHEVEIQRSRLATAVGVAPDEIEVRLAALGAPTYEEDESALLTAARHAHPTILALDAAVRAAQANEKLASRGNLPSIHTEARGEWHGDDEHAGVERESYFVAVVVDFPFFDGGRTVAARAEAQANVQAAAAARREAANAIEDAARTAHRRASEAIARVAIADSAVVAARQASAILEQRYRDGLARVVDLLEAERDVTEARLRALEARAAAWTAIAAVERVAGDEVEQ